MASSMKNVQLTIFSLLALHLISATSAFSETPFIVAHKKISLARLKPEVQLVSVSIDIYNRGSATAYDVTLTDDSWAQFVFNSIIGNTSKTWDRLDVGSLVSHSFELQSAEKTTYYGAPAVITFRMPSKASLQVAYSTPILPLDILADSIPEKKFELRFFGKYGSHVGVIAIVVLFAHIIASPKSTAANGSKKKK